jgi:hypothetical protein
MRRVFGTAAALAFLVACTTTPSSGGATGTTLRIGEFNMEYGGTQVDWDQTVAVARALDADVIGLEEAWGNTRKLAAALGYPYADPRRQLISKLPILRAPGDPKEYVYLEIAPGSVVAIGNVHLSSSAYGPNHTDTDDPASIMATEERVRVPEIEPYARALAGLAAAGVPAFLTGDLNSPSHLDWTAATVDARRQVRYPLDWPVTETLAQSGFTDSYRAVHPDPAADPGLTWPAERPKVRGAWNPSPNAPQDRIDTIQSVGPATATTSDVITEDQVDPWPSDHRAVVSTFSVTPAAPPTLVSPDEQLVRQGDVATVRVHGAGEVQVATEGQPMTSQTVDGTDAALSFDTSAWEPGRYDLSLTDPGGARLATAPIWVEGPDDGPALSVAPLVPESEPVRVEWRFAPGNRWDWIGIYHRGADPNVDSYLLWAYTDGTIEGHVRLDEDAVGTFPLPPGDYTATLLMDDGYEDLARANFTVTPN